MTVNINLQEFSRQFSNIEQMAILANCIETAFRYDYEAVARTIEMPGRTIFAGRGSWRTKGMLTDWLLLADAEFKTKYGNYHTLTDADYNIFNRKRTLLEQTLEAAGFERWASEFLKIYSLSWIVSRFTYVLSVTRPGLNHDTAEYNLTLTLDGVR